MAPPRRGRRIPAHTRRKARRRTRALLAPPARSARYFRSTTGGLSPQQLLRALAFLSAQNAPPSARAEARMRSAFFTRGAYPRPGRPGPAVEPPWRLLGGRLFLGLRAGDLLLDLEAEEERLLEG